MANWSQAVAPTSGAASPVSTTVSNVGDVLWIAGLANAPAATITFTCSNLTSVNYFGASATCVTVSGFTFRLAWGRVATTGTASIAMATTAGTVTDIAAGSVTPPTGTTSVAQDGTQGTANANTSTIGYPSQTPAGPNDFYLGYAVCINDATAGSSSGFTYFLDVIVAGLVYSLDPSSHAGAAPNPSAPTAPATGPGWDAIAGLLVASIPTTPVIVSTNFQVFSNSLAAFTCWVNPSGQSTTVGFNYGASSSYGSNTGTVATITGNAPVYVSYPLTGLSSGQTVHFQVTATNASGTTNGPDTVLVTAPAPRFSGGLGLGALGAFELTGPSGITGGSGAISSSVFVTTSVTVTGPTKNVALTAAVTIGVTVAANVSAPGSSNATGLTPIIPLITPVYPTTQASSTGGGTPVIPVVRPTATTVLSNIVTGLTPIIPVVQPTAQATASGSGASLTASVSITTAVGITLTVNEGGSAAFAFTATAAGSFSVPSSTTVTSLAAVDGGSPLSTPTITPTAGSILIVPLFFFAFNAGTASISDTFGDTGGGTWTPFANSVLTVGAFGIGYGGWYRQVGTSPSAGTVTVTVSGWGGGETTYCVDQVASGGTLSVPQTNATALFPGAPGTGTVTLPSPPASTSVVWSGTGNAQNALTPTVNTAGYTFTQLDLINTGTSSSEATAYIVGSGPQGTTWQGLSTTNESALFAVEISASAAPLAGTGSLSATFTATATATVTIGTSGSVGGSFTAGATGSVALALTASVSVTSAVAASVTRGLAAQPAPRPIFVRPVPMPRFPLVQYGPRYFVSLVVPQPTIKTAVAVNVTVTAALSARFNLTAAVAITSTVHVPIVNGYFANSNFAFTATAAGTVFIPTTIVSSMVTFDGGSPGITPLFTPTTGAFLVVSLYAFPFAAGTATIADTFGDTGGTTWTPFANSSFTSTGAFGTAYGAWYRQVGATPVNGNITVAISGWTGGEQIIVVDQVVATVGTLAIIQSNCVAINFPGAPANGTITLPNPPSPTSVVWTGSGSGANNDGGTPPHPLTPTVNYPGFAQLDLVNGGTSLTEATAYMLTGAPQTVPWQGLSGGHTNSLYALEVGVSGTTSVSGTGTLSITFSGVANGVVNVAASGTVTGVFTATATGAVVATGTGALTGSFTATATGTVITPVAGTAALSASFTATAAGTGTVPVAGTGSLAAVFTATATGTFNLNVALTSAVAISTTVTAQIVAGYAAGATYGFTATATGLVTFPATGAVSSTFSATAAGTTISPSAGTAAFSATFAAAAGGAVVNPGTGTGAMTTSFTAAATGTMGVFGSGQLAATFLAAATGTFTAPAITSGALQGTFTATATGLVVIGVTTAGWNASFTAVAVGSAPAAAVASFGFVARAIATHTGNAPSQVIQAAPRFFIVQATDERGWD